MKHIYLGRDSFYPFLDRMLAPQLKWGKENNMFPFLNPLIASFELRLTSRF